MAVSWEGELDPSETLDFRMDFQGGDDPVLDVGEEIASFSLAVTAEAALHGLTILNAGDYAPAVDETGTQIVLWLEVDDDEQDNVAFVDGVTLGVEGTIVTTSTPARTRQRTFNVTVKQL